MTGRTRHGSLPSRQPTIAGVAVAPIRDAITILVSIFPVIDTIAVLIAGSRIGVAASLVAFAGDFLSDLFSQYPPDAWAHARVEVRGGPPPGIVERATLLALPLATGLGVGWARRGAASDATPSGGTLHG